MCSPDDIFQFIDACLQESGNEQVCNDFVSANSACATCFGYPGRTMLQPVLISGEFFILPNVTTCEALVQGKPACAAEVTNFNFCVFNSCGQCGDFEFDQCVQFSQGACSASFPVSDECSTLLDVQSPECGGDEIFQLITNLATVICG